MKLRKPGALVHVPDGRPLDEALRRTTHLGIVAHPDDLEILAARGILECYEAADLSFCGVVITDGAGSARTGPYAAYDDAQMRAVRREEQKRAADLGKFGAVVMLDYSSQELRENRAAVVSDLEALLGGMRPRLLHTHNLADRHSTHVAAALAAIEACRKIPPEVRPDRLLGGEVWRDLDWLSAADKVAEDVGGREKLAADLIAVFDSQIAGGKRYDLAVAGRRRANATYHESHAIDAATALAYAMDLTPLVEDPGLSPLEFVEGLLERFGDEVRGTLEGLIRGK
jgi:LmbE family N-acetylglucosaminyl deacetylase